MDYRKWSNKPPVSNSPPPPISIKPPGVKAFLRNKPPFRTGGLIRFFTIITVLSFLWLKSKYDSIISILLDIPCYYATKTKKKKKKKITECGNKAGGEIIVIVELILIAWNDISWETIRKSLKSCALKTALDRDEDDLIHCFKPEENPFVAILGDITEATSTEMLIDEDEEQRETKKLLYFYDVLFEIFLSEK